MKVVYGAKAVRNNQKNFTMVETSKKPDILDIPSDGCYMLIVVDPDAGKQRPNDPRPGNYYLHWIVANITGGDIDSGQQIVPYQKPTPPIGTGKHEYRFLLYKQPCVLTQGLKAPDVLSNWSLEGFLRGKQVTLMNQASLYVSQ